MLRRLYKKIKHSVVTMRFTILSVFIIFFAATIFSILLIVSAIFSDSLSFTAKASMKSASSAIEMTADRGLQPITVQTDLTVNLLEKNILKTDPDDLLTYFYSLAQAMPFVQSVYWGDKNGNSIVTN